LDSMLKSQLQIVDRFISDSKLPIYTISSHFHIYKSVLYLFCMYNCIMYNCNWTQIWVFL